MSKSYDKFSKNMKEIEDLTAMHEDITEEKVGRPAAKVAVLNKAGLVLVCAFWQSYCEELLFEILRKYKNGKAQDVPDALRAVLGGRMLGAKSPDFTAVWKFTSKGWADEIENLVVHLEGDTSRPLDTPNSENVNAAFQKYLGIKNIGNKWFWQGMTHQQAAKKLDGFIKRRHRVAHRGADTQSVNKLHVQAFVNHVTRLAEKTDDWLRREGYVT